MVILLVKPQVIYGLDGIKDDSAKPVKNQPGKGLLSF